MPKIPQKGNRGIPFFYNLYTCHGCAIRSNEREKLLDIIRDGLRGIALRNVMIDKKAVINVKEDKNG
ncbi:hypothetical protein KSC_030620 [Ktedonobacter sp. SOSP1-52]|nr:hypothetical protein KSC_030620 [Ktedonobacter sp. SOSP1-52]